MKLTPKSNKTGAIMSDKKSEEKHLTLWKSVAAIDPVTAFVKNLKTTHQTITHER